MAMPSDMLRGPSPKYRRWRDLKIWRLAVGLAIAPAVPILSFLGCVALFSGFSILQIPEIYASVTYLIGATSVWAIFVGLCYSLTIARWRGVLGRSECLLLGVGAAFLLPFAVIAVDTIIDNQWAGDWRNWKIFHPQLSALSETIGIAIKFGLFLALFGLPAGWAFWRIGVYPAKLPGSELVNVFD